MKYKNLLRLNYEVAEFYEFNIYNFQNINKVLTSVYIKKNFEVTK
jgi:hypothetical protein